MTRANPADFPFKKTRDLRSAMAKALASYIGTLAFRYPATSTPTRLAAVYDTWASFEQRALSSGAGLPAAVVLPDRALPDDDSFTPRLLEETWTGGDPHLLDAAGAPLFPRGTAQGDGYALYAVAEKVVPFLVLFRASSKPQREAIVSAVEDAFVRVDPPEGVGVVGWGRWLTLADYYARPMRVTYKAHQLLDAEGPAQANRWMVQFELLAEAKQVLPGRVPAMEVRVALMVDGSEAAR